MVRQDGPLEIEGVPNGYPVAVTVTGGSGSDVNLVEVGGDPIALEADGSLPVTIVAGGTGGGDVNLTEVGGVAVSLGQKTMAASVPVVLASDETALPVTGPLTDTQLRATPVPISGTVTANAGTNLNTSLLATESTLSTLNGKVTACNTGAVVVSSSALPSGASTSALQTQPGVDIGDVTVNNAGGGAAVNIQDGGNSITIDGSITTVTTVTSITNAVTTTAVGTIADDATTPGNPVMTGGMAKSPDGTDPGSVAENDVVRFIADLNRRQFVNTNHPTAQHAHLNGSTAYTDQALIADPGDGFQIVITGVIASTGAATALNFFLEEGTTTTVFGPIYLEAVAGRGFCSGPICHPVTASTSITITSSASIAQSFDVYYYVQAV